MCLLAFLDPGQTLARRPLRINGNGTSAARRPDTRGQANTRRLLSTSVARLSEQEVMPTSVHYRDGSAALGPKSDRITVAREQAGNHAAGRRRNRNRIAAVRKV